MVRAAIVIGMLIGMLGCGDDSEPQATCAVPATSVVSFGDCHRRMADGTECVTFCGQLPDDGSAGTTLAVGCQVQIGASAPETGTCVASCADCP